MYMRYLYLMLILYKESKKLSQIVHKSSEILLFLRVLDSFGQLRGFGQDGLNLSIRCGFYHFVQNLPTLVCSWMICLIAIFRSLTKKFHKKIFRKCCF